MAAKKKSECTPQEWAAILEAQRAYRNSAKGQATTRRAYAKVRPLRLEQMRQNYQRTALHRAADKMNALDAPWLEPSPAKPASIDHAALVAAASRAVEKLPAPFRGDALSELTIAALSGHIDIDALEAAAWRFCRHEQRRERFGWVSIDQPINASTTICLRDTIAADAFHF